MSVINNVIEGLTTLQVKIQDELYKTREQIANISLRPTLEDVKKHEYVKLLIKKNKDLRKENHRLEKQLLKFLLNQSVNEPIIIKDEPVIIIEEPTTALSKLIEKQNITISIPDEPVSATLEEEVEVEEEEEEVVEVEVEEVVEVEVEEEEVVEVEEEEEEEEVVEVEEEEEEVEVEEEEEVVEVEVEEEEVVEVEVEEEEEEEDSVYEVTIKGKTYYVTNEVDSVIYEADENGDISVEAGVYKNGKPTFYAKK